MNRKELKHKRSYLFQKIIDVAECNTDRIKIIWNRLWSIISDHIIKVGCYPNKDISVFAIDSLR